MESRMLYNHPSVCRLHHARFLVIIISQPDSAALKYCKASSKPVIGELSPFSIVCSSREPISLIILNFRSFSLAINIFSKD